MEVKMGITWRWEPLDSEYADTMRYMATQKYHRALDELQRLVVLQLFELHKLNLSQTGNFIFQCVSYLTMIFMLQGIACALILLKPSKLTARQFKAR
jgi:predicted ferric reductase